jgi:hypothetical protein
MKKSSGTLMDLRRKKKETMYKPIKDLNEHYYDPKTLYQIRKIDESLSEEAKKAKM